MASENSFNGNNRNALIDQMDWNSLEKENINVDTLEQDRNSPVRSPAQDTPRKTESSSKKSSGAKLYAYAQQRQRAHFDAAKSKENFEQDRNDPLRRPSQEKSPQTDNFEKNSSHLLSYTKQHQNAYQHFDAAQNNGNNENVQQQNYYYAPLPYPVRDTVSRPDNFQLNPMNPYYYTQQQRDFNSYAIRAYHGWGGRGTFA